MAMLYAVHVKCGQAPIFCFPCSLMCFYLELELVKASARTWFNVTSDTVSEEEMD